MFIDSRDETKFPDFQEVDLERVNYCLPGVSANRYKLESVDFSTKQILCLRDCAAASKRGEVLLAAFLQVYKNLPLQLLVAGKGVSGLNIPARIAHAVARLGYVTQESLNDLYQQSALFAPL